MASRLLEWTILACFPAGVFLILGLMELPAFADPCHTWGAGGSGMMTPPATSECVGHTSTTETRAQAMTRLMLFQGTTILGLVVGVVGAARDHRLLVGVGAGLLVAISLPLIGSVEFAMPLLSGLLFGLGLVLHRAPPAARLEGP